MDDQARAQEARKQKRLDKLGTNDPKCPVCGITDWRVFELNHLAKKRFGEFVHPLCKNHHAIVTDAQNDRPEQVCNPPHPFERIGHFMLGLAELFTLIVASLREFGHYLIDQAKIVLASQSDGTIASGCA